MNHPGTRLETDEEVQRALQKHRPARGAPAQPLQQPAPADDAPALFRPTQRPPTPVLVVLDDGEETGEERRVRTERFVIGRTEGDLVIPHDSQMSGRHAELRRTWTKDKHRWQLVDLDSTNGTYVRVGSAVLQDGQEFLLGRTRFRFEGPAKALAAAKPPDPVNQTTLPWTGDVAPALAPSVCELTAEGIGGRVLLPGKELWLGKDASCCGVVLRQDPFVSARHARIRLGDDGVWVIENNKSVNGVWLRVTKIPLRSACRFLLGEQQFLLRLPTT
jgi:pSer/pThr/pTyr-binding forkhead associated (FHA) protein